MKNVKRILLVSLMILTTGCFGVDLTKYYDKMQVAEDGINGYTLDLRIYGKYYDEAINEIVRVENYQDEEFEIRFPREERETEKNTATIIKDGKVYLDGEYLEDASEVKYSNPGIYLEGLKEAKKVTKPKEETLGENKYQVYEFFVNEDFVQKMINNTDFDSPELIKETKAEVWINSEGYVFQVIYYLEDLTIDANYLNVNKAQKIVY
ncbi:MAG TPA: hypothetical protein GX690_00730 [Tenericutes bacterium]|nr:hypothetical protein [Mycoplasmatota bacterium]